MLNHQFFYLEAGTSIAILCVQLTYEVTWFLRIANKWLIAHKSRLFFTYNDDSIRD